MYLLNLLVAAAVVRRLVSFLAHIRGLACSFKQEVKQTADWAHVLTGIATSQRQQLLSFTVRLKTAERCWRKSARVTNTDRQHVT